MLIIDNGSNLGDKIVLVAGGRNISTCRLSYFEDISHLRIHESQATLAVRNLIIPVESKIWFLNRPSIRYPNSFPQIDLEFSWAEWQSALVSYLYINRNNVPNAKMLLFRDAFRNNPFIMMGLKNVLLQEDLYSLSGKDETLWHLLSRKGLYIYTETTKYTNVADFSERGRYGVLSELDRCGIDYVIAESRILNESWKTTVHLTPPQHVPDPLLEALLWLFI